MKIYFLILLSFGFCKTGSTQVLGVKDIIPPEVFDSIQVLQPAGNSVSKGSFSFPRNKMLLIDFWATWCGPCISSLSKYEDLQKQFSVELEIITVSHESLARIQSFLKNRPVTLTMAVDTGESMRKYFPYRTIPHVILLDKNRKIVAITHSTEITPAVIRDVSQGKRILLPFKNDDTKFDYEADYFQVNDTVQQSFNLQPGIEGVGSFSKIGKGIFKDRRISMHNFTIDGLYRMAYKLSYYRTVYEMGKAPFDYAKPENKFCLDVIVPEHSAKTPNEMMQERLPEYTLVKTRIEKRKLEVYVLKRIDSAPALIKSSEENDSYSGSSNFFTGNGVKISALADYLESFGLLNAPVLDETGIAGRYDLHMEWEPEKKGALKDAFSKAGFVLEKAERELEVLVFFSGNRQ